MNRSAALLLALAAVLVTGCGTAAPPSSAPPVATPIDLTAAPAQLQWDRYQGVLLPRSPVDGPSVTDVVAIGYKQTPQGAVLAAIRGQAYLALAGDTDWGEVVIRVTAPGPGRDHFAAQRAPLSVTGPVPADVATRFVAFRIDRYNATDQVTAAVQVVTETADGTARFAYPVALHWLAGDWRIVLPTADEFVDALELPTLEGFTLLEGR